jgi:hypothetical protein
LGLGIMTTGDRHPRPGTRRHASIRRLAALMVAGLVLTGGSCARSGASSVDDLSRVLGRSASETEAIVGGSASSAETTASRWLARIEEYADSDAREACSLVLTLSGTGTPKTYADLQELLQLTSAITNPSPEVANLRDATATTLIEGVESTALAGAIVAFDETLC